MPRTTGTPFRSEVVSAAPSAMYAAAKNYSVGKAQRNWVGTDAQRVDIQWQNDCWDFYDVIGEYRYSVDWVGNLLSKAKLLVKKSGEQATDQRALDAIASLFGGPEGQSEMLRQLGIHFTVAGEAYIIGVDDNNEDDWYVAASTEVRRDAFGAFKIGEGSDQIRVPADGSIIIRIWRPHPRKPRKATSPSRAVMPILSELLMLTKYIAAQGDSRLTGAGLLILPSQITFPATPTKTASGGEDGEEVQSTSQDASGFLQQLIDVASIAIDNQQDAAAKVPVVLQVDGEYIDKVQHLKFWSDFDQHAMELRKEAISRLALGLDMPPEVLTGVADVNHWGAWQIEEATIKSHSEPLLAVITSSLTVGYLRPVLESMGMSTEEAAEYEIAADTSELRLRPNRSKEAQELYNLGILNRDAVLRENGFDQADMMDDEERSSWLTLKLAQGQTTPELVAAGLREMGVDAVAAPEAASRTHEKRPDPSLLEHPTRDIPNGGRVPEGVVAAGEMMVLRALERAGNRLKKMMHLQSTPVPARELYLRYPEIAREKVDDLLTDAWSCTSWGVVDVEPNVLEAALDEYTRSLLVSGSKHSRGAMVQHMNAWLA